jgi:hypothetical protein
MTSAKADRVNSNMQQATNELFTSKEGLVEITTLKDFERYWHGSRHGQRRDDGIPSSKSQRDYVALLKRLSIRGDTQIIGSKDHPEVLHSVAKLLHESCRKQMQMQQYKENRLKEIGAESGKGPINVGSLKLPVMNTERDIRSFTTATLETPTTQAPFNDDCNKVAPVIMGGGMRGCVSTGMACALHHLGLQDTIDVVYGSSTGAVVAAYFCSQQVPWFRCEVYYDQVTTAGDKFIDLKRLLRSLGFGLADPRFLRDVLSRQEIGKPLLNLNFLVDTTMQEAKPLDFGIFKASQAVQPLKVVTTSLTTGEPMVLLQESGHLDTLEDLCSSLHTSCLLPGIAGPVMNALRTPENKGTKKVEDQKRSLCCATTISTTAMIVTNMHRLAMSYYPLPFPMTSQLRMELLM